jgi:AcrR family transcriptional regulator
MTQERAQKQERGRPRNFDPDMALDQALAVFWRNGFQGASMAELTEAMGLSKPSLYATFGDKEALYLKALDRYASQWLAQHIDVLEQDPDGRSAVQAFLRSVAAMLTDPTLPGGCFVVNGMADCGGPSTPAAVELALQKMLQGSEEKVRERLTRAQRDGQLSKDVNSADLASFIYALLAGLGVKAKGGATRANLYAAIKSGMAAWPERSAR